MNNKLVVLSLDSLQSSDLDFLFKLPNFSSLKPKMAIVKNLQEIYPTLTYPIHTTILTGVTPDKHGIFHNQKPDVDPKEHDWNLMGSNWYWYKENVKVKTLIDAICENNKTFASICWPCTAGDKRGINLPEIWPPKGSNKSPERLFKEAFSEEAFDKYFESYISKFNWNDNEDLVRFTPEIAIDVLKNDKPDLLLCHVIWLDHIRHNYGVEGYEVEDSLRQLDSLVGNFIQATKTAGTFENTNFVILGDHGQINIERIFDLNVLFVEEGLITLGENKNPIDYTAFSFSTGFSTQIHLKNPENQQDVKKVYDVLKKLKLKYPNCIEKIYTRQQVLEEEHLDGPFSFVIEGTVGTCFGKKFYGSVVIEKDSDEFYMYKATHGHSVKKGKKPPLLAFGPDINSNAFIENAKMIDVCPTLAKLCNVKMYELMGNELNILLKKKA